MSDDNDIGYGKPPKSGQFQKGQSGNPGGRPISKKRYLGDIIGQVLKEEKAVLENGQPKKMSAAEIILRRIRDKAMGGHCPSIKRLMDLQKRSKLAPGTHRMIEIEDFEPGLRIFWADNDQDQEDLEKLFGEIEESGKLYYER